jgi:hypothetical protein
LRAVPAGRERHGLAPLDDGGRVGVGVGELVEQRVRVGLLDQLRETFQLTGVTLLERRDDTPPGPDLRRDPTAWRVAAVGDQPCLTPAQGDTDVPVDDRVSLVLRGHPLPAGDRRVIEAFAALAAVALRQERLAEQAAAVQPLAEIDGSAPRCCPRSATTYVPRSPPPRPPSTPCAAVTSSSAPPTATNCSPPPRNPSTGSAAWWTTCWT